MPWWQSIQVLPLFANFAGSCFLRARLLCSSRFILSRLWQLRHSLESVALIDAQTLSAKYSRLLSNFSGVSIVPSILCHSSFVELFFEHKRGTKRVSVNHLTDAVTLAQTIDQQASRIVLGSNFSSDGSLLSISYQGSRFSNDQKALSWNNPLLAEGHGQQSVAPDNSSHRLNIKGRYGIGRNQLQGSYTFTTQYQDQSFLASSINGSIYSSLVQAGVPLDLSGRVNKHALRLKATFKPRAKFKFQTAFNYDQRDNNTPIITLTPVINDSYIGSERTSRAYDYSRWTLRFTGDYKIDRQNKLLFTLEQLQKEYSYQARERNDRRQIKAQWRFNDWRKVESSVVLKRELYSGDDYPLIVGSLSESQQQLRRFNLSDYNLTHLDWTLGYFVNQNWFTRLNLDWSLKDFDQSQLGVIEQRVKQLQWSVTYRHNEVGTFQLLSSYRFEDNLQAGSSWQATDAQREVLWQLSWNKKALSDEVLSYGARLSYSDSEGQLGYKLYSIASLNPPVIGEKLSVAGHVKYRIDDDYDVRLDLKYQDYEESIQGYVMPVEILMSQGQMNSIYDSSYVGVKLIRKL